MGRLEVTKNPHGRRNRYNGNMNDLPPVALALSELHIAYRVFTHAGAVNSLEQAAQERGQRPSQVVRSILFRLGADRFAMVLIAGPDQVSWRALRQHLGQSRLTMASEDEVLAITGYPIGAVSPFGLPQPLPVYIDDSVTAEAEISIGSGRRGTTIILRSADLLAALPGAEIGRFRT
jgi:Cys-tRNA(Pro) deacylase